MYSLIFFIADSFTTGPICASAVSGGPSRNAFVFSTTFGMNAFAQVWGAILPVRWYMAVLLGQAARGLPLADSARPCRHAVGDRWFVDETYVKVAGRWRYVYRAVDQYGQVIDVLLSGRRDLAAARRFFTRALRAGTIPVQVTTDRAPVYPRVLDELVPSALHTLGQYANNPVEADHGQLKARLWPMRGLKRHRSAPTLAAGHALVQNLRRDHYDIATEGPGRHRLRLAFDDLALAI